MSNQNWKEAKEVLYPAIRWEVTAEPGKEDSTVYLGPTVQGIYVSKKDGIGANNSTIYTLEVPTVGKVGVWGSSVLDAKMALVAIGDEVRINFLGTQKAKVAGRKPWRNFRVESAKPVTQMVEVDGASQAAAPAGATAPAVAGTGEEF